MDFDVKEFQKQLTGELSEQWKLVPKEYKSQIQRAGERIAKRRAVAAMNLITGSNNSVGPASDSIVSALEAELKSFAVTEGASLIQAVADFIVKRAFELVKGR